MTKTEAVEILLSERPYKRCGCVRDGDVFLRCRLCKGRGFMINRTWVEAKAIIDPMEMQAALRVVANGEVSVEERSKKNYYASHALAYKTVELYKEQHEPD